MTSRADLEHKARTTGTVALFAEVFQRLEDLEESLESIEETLEERLERLEGNWRIGSDGVARTIEATLCGIPLSAFSPGKALEIRPVFEGHDDDTSKWALAFLDHVIARGTPNPTRDFYPEAAQAAAQAVYAIKELLKSREQGHGHDCATDTLAACVSATLDSLDRDVREARLSQHERVASQERIINRLRHLVRQLEGRAAEREYRESYPTWPTPKSPKNIDSAFPDRVAGVRQLCETWEELDGPITYAAAAAALRHALGETSTEPADES